MLTLIVDLGTRREQFVFTTESVAIGRHEENDLRVGSRFVSQHHCRVQKVAKGWKVVDLKSQNGTRVNGVEVTQKILKIGDRIDLGQIAVWFGEAPDDDVTETLDPGTDELTPAPSEEVIVSARSEGGARGTLAADLSTLLLEYRKAFGDERGLMEIERAVANITGRLFPRPAFSLSSNASKLVEISKAINSELNLKRCLTLIIDSIIALSEAERGFLILIDEKGQMKVKVARNFDAESVTKADFKFSRSITEKVAQTGEAVISTSAQDDRRFTAFHSVEQMKLRSVLCLPFRLRDRVSGVLYLDHRFKKGAFVGRDLEFVESFCDQAAIAIENARLYEENRKTQEELLQRKKEVEELNAILDSKLKQKEIELSEIRSYAPKHEEFKFDYSFIVAGSPSMMKIFQLLERIIPSEIPVLITGESGTGKELIAKAIHINGARKDKTFVKENCAAIPETLLESELFGYKKGAFTGADRDKIGLFQQADGGTLFLDEIGEMSLDMQKKLLRVLQESEVRPVGGHETLKIDVRLVSASNRNLKKMAESGEFREDLYYRLKVMSVELPPLRDRLEDIPMLVDFFLVNFVKRHGGNRRLMDDIALRCLLQYHWPGNVRELEHAVMSACALGGDVITSDDLPKDIIAEAPPSDVGAKKENLWKDIVKMTAHQKEREIILKTLEESEWKKSAAARTLGISRPTLDNKIKTFGLGPYIKRGKMSR